VALVASGPAAARRANFSALPGAGPNGAFTSSASLRVTTYTGYSSLPESAAAVFSPAAAGDLLHSRQWLSNAEQNGLRPGDCLRIFAVHGGGNGELVALFPAVYSRLYASHPGARVLHFTLPEDQDYSPLAPAGAAVPAGAAAAVCEALRAAKPAYDVIRVGPLPAGEPLAAEFAAALRRTGHLLQGYPQAPARFEIVAGMSSKEYLAQRPRPLRESLERNTRLLLQGGRGRFHLAVDRVLLAATWGDVQRIVDEAPVEGEAEPADSLSSMLGVAADDGALRLGLLYLDDAPVAMQFWVVGGGVARCLRIWGAQGQRPFPIDDVLTQMMAVCLIDGDRVAELVFGAIDEAFARNWAPQSRGRFGLAAFTPRTWRGLRGALRHVGGQQLKALPARAWQRLIVRPRR
jgi:hypothetical protein